MKLNWYKTALEEQQAFDFHNDPRYQGEKDNSYFREWAKTHGLSPKLLEKVLEESEISGAAELKLILNQLGFNWQELKLKNNTIIVVRFGNGRNNDDYVIDDFDYPSVIDAKEWINKIYDHELFDYVDFVDFNKDFWDGVRSGYSLYHATNPENKDEILKSGLMTMDKSRRISNRFMGSAIFTSDEPDPLESYGSLVFEINVGQMKADGYMPTVSMEEPFEDVKARESLAAKLGIEDYDYTSEYASEGLYDNTVAFYDNIPPKYLKVYSE